MKTKSAIFEAVHETSSDLLQHGFIDQKRMREYDLLCLKVLPDYSAEQIKEIRNKYRMSQPVFASLLNTSLSTVKQWEIGDKRPSGVSTKLLSILDKRGIDVFI
jgi:putative transcriptional regulator